MAGKKKQGKTQFYAAALIAAAFFILALSIGVLAQKNSFKVVLPMHVVVTTGVMGFNVTQSLEFGSIPPSGGGRKVVFITNHFDSDKKVFLRAYGEMESWISVSQNEIPIKGKETLNVSVFALVPAGTAPGDYYGTLEITIG